MQSPLPRVFFWCVVAPSLMLVACSGQGGGGEGTPGRADGGGSGGDGGGGGDDVEEHGPCAFRACGDDGSGGSCGTCGGDDSCSDYGQCVRDQTGDPVVVYTFDQDLKAILRIDAEGEATVFYDQSGSVPFYNSLGLFTLSESHLLAAQNHMEFTSGAPGSILSLRDDNGDGDALDEGEASVYFDGALPGGYQLILPTGLRRGTDGNIYLSENNYDGSTNPEAIYRLVDGNGDGDVNDEGEVEIAFEIEPDGTNNASTWETVVDSEGQFYVKENADAKDATMVHRITEAGLLSQFLSGYQLFPMTEGGENLVLAYTPGELGYNPKTDEIVTVAENYGGTVYAHLIAARDHDLSTSIDSLDEFRILWDGGEDDSDLDISARDFEVLEDGSIVVMGLEHIVHLVDENGDGDMNDAGEVIVLFDGSTLGAGKLLRLDALLL